MPKIDNKKFYESAINKHGVNARGLNWNSKISQELRFDVILDMLPNKISNHSIVDVGCGFGDFYLYMLKNNKKPKNYIGIDALEKMCLIAEEKTKQKIIQADVIRDELPHADFYVCSGAMNILTKFETHIFIRKAIEASNIGFVFNALHGKQDSDTYNYLSYDEIFNIAGDLNVEISEMDDSYIEDDITVFLTKDIEL